MEEEVELLLQAELLKKINHEKYLTNFFIVPRECQNEINEKCCGFCYIWNQKRSYNAKSAG